tara:strand:- start:1521 stop:2156 length:636 start_codon:yes stop_codon:yes gene_type:complete
MASPEYNNKVRQAQSKNLPAPIPGNPGETVYVQSQLDILSCLKELIKSDLFGTEPCCCDWGTLFRLYAAQKYVFSHLKHNTPCDEANEWYAYDYTEFVVGSWVQNNGSCFMLIAPLPPMWTLQYTGPPGGFMGNPRWWSLQLNLITPGETDGWQQYWQVSGTPSEEYTGADCVWLYLKKKTGEIFASSTLERYSVTSAVQQTLLGNRQINR